MANKNQEAIRADNEKVLSQVIFEQEIVADNESSTTQVRLKKSMLTIVLDLNGLLVMRSQQPSQVYPSFQVSKNIHYIIRPGCLEFLKMVLERFNVGIWSTAMEKNVLQMVKCLQEKVGQVLPFFAIWGQEGCLIYSKRKLFRPDKPNVEAMFKPLEKMGRCFDLDPMRTILIDDSPYKGCVSTSSNCIFPTSFDLSNKEDNILLGDLLPYLSRLDEANDVRNVIELDRLGQLPVVHDHELFSKFSDVIETCKEKNMIWSQTRITTGRLPIAAQLSKITSTTTTTKAFKSTEGQEGDGKEASSSSRKVYKLTDHEIRSILTNAIPQIPNMKMG